ncbi:glycosyltransferase family 2 protein [Urbifossiella limnaea]|uniref:Poly-beta-1,6-N-acetyl-D-glucosamine synthase n=1 Tax=Urbifossiella limnaea TaxID=2528023 RepID=A0A517XT69_9BACT|nr:glycosyltransferase family 2 protein [Urbifossiella limnaea]QDU20674.1 Poly-beta-1,6-N-acetyl-D-glucosamine synthase [Urbifossiella limnaea]
MTGTAVCLGLLAPATAVAATQAALAALGRFPRRRQSPQSAQLPAIVVLIPAHDEEGSLSRALRSVAEQEHPAVRVVVVADNCTDRTADVAAGYGARVVTRSDAARRGKGYAVAAGLHALRDDSFDAVLILDADCTLNRAALAEIATTLASGAGVVQASLRSLNADAGPGGFVAAVGSVVDAAVAAGRERLGFRGRLRGTGMAFCRSALGRVRWATASPVEDAEYERQLRDAGLCVRYCPGAEVSAAAPPRLKDLCRQRRRWAAAGPAESKPLGLVLAAAAVTAALALSQFVGWACALAATLILLYGSAAAEVGLTRRRLGFALAAPVVVGRLACVAVAGWLKPDRGWEPARAG